ncbi:hypothetical protein A6764_18950 [Brevibacillus sp. WF146]|uniref:hypothetical protein n=1 Tax=Brevibacillus sp. WF146 TaxID=319501 RepID=UPI00114631FD|nr:hypothetical protein [Brevibacillus sp. WF146]UYZ12859.1 hypothetical protein A6764_18950 [Brevibacillus sp. WF146]
MQERLFFGKDCKRRLPYMDRGAKTKVLVQIVAALCVVVSGLYSPESPETGADEPAASQEKAASEIVILSPQERSVFKLPIPENQITVAGKIDGYVQPGKSLQIGLYGGQENYKQHMMYAFDYPVNPDGTFTVHFPVGRLVPFPNAKPDHYTLELTYPHAPTKTVTVVIQKQTASD